MTSALCLSDVFHTANQTSSPALLYSGCTTRFGPSPRSAHSAIGRTSKPLARSSILNTATDCEIAGVGCSGVSTHKLRDCGCVLMNSEPPPCPFRVSTTVQAYFLYLRLWGLVPISEMPSSPRLLVAQTGPYSGCLKLAPRPGCGMRPTSTSASSLRSFESTTAIVSDWLAADMK